MHLRMSIGALMEDKEEVAVSGTEGMCCQESPYLDQHKSELRADGASSDVNLLQSPYPGPATFETASLQEDKGE